MTPDDRVGFLMWIVGEHEEGHLWVGSRGHRDGAWREQAFVWPHDIENAERYFKARLQVGDVYFCPTLVHGPKRTKEHIHFSQVLWADLDTCDPGNLLVPPTVVIRTSRGKYQAYWKLNRLEPAEDVEDLNRRIAYKHADQGCDKTGWDLTQYLRVPGTRNFKYADSGEVHDIGVVEFEPTRVYDLKVDFSEYKDVLTAPPMPDVKPIPLPREGLTPQDIMDRIRASVNGAVWAILEHPPDTDWSGSMWQLEQLLFTAGCSDEEVYVIVRQAPCNKYLRDKRINADELLWREVLKAHQFHEKRVVTHNVEPDEVDWFIPEDRLLTDEERERAKRRRTVIEEYISWGQKVGDAAIQFHEAGVFTILSALLAGPVRLPTSFGTIIPNLWFMLLADTTVDRKTTAMDMATDMIEDIDIDIIVATDGTIEGLMTSLSMRPGNSSLFKRDEFSGFLKQVEKRDYYAGMLEALTKLYDGKLQKRVLRKEIITVKDPVLLLFVGGIKNEIYSLLTEDHINSGFVPRFCFVTATGDITKLRALGPPNNVVITGREELLERFRDMYAHYHQPAPPEKPGDLSFGPKRWNASLTSEAWLRYNKLEHRMLEIAQNSSHPHLLTPVLVRLCTSGLKAAVLLAASERLTNEVVVEEHDIVQAFYYVERWKTHALNVVANAGKTASEKLLEEMYIFVQEYPSSNRAKVMQRFHLTAREMDALVATLQQRGLIRVDRGSGKSEVYFPIHATRKAKTKDDARP